MSRDPTEAISRRILERDAIAGRHGAACLLALQIIRQPEAVLVINEGAVFALSGPWSVNVWHPALVHPAGEPNHSHVFSFRSRILLGRLHHRRHRIHYGRGPLLCHVVRVPNPLESIARGESPRMQISKSRPCSLSTRKEGFAVGASYALRYGHLHAVEPRGLTITLVRRYQYEPDRPFHIVNGGRQPIPRLYGSAYVEKVAPILTRIGAVVSEALSGSDEARDSLDRLCVELGSHAPPVPSEASL